MNLKDGKIKDLMNVRNRDIAYCSSNECEVRYGCLRSYIPTDGMISVCDFYESGCDCKYKKDIR